MTDIPDREVLAEFARSESESAFAELVRRHIALVHSAAQRHTDNPQHAQEITQAVFIILARKAVATVPKQFSLTGFIAGRVLLATDLPLNVSRKLMPGKVARPK